MSESLLVRALRGEKVERVPVWAMRPAGRCEPQFPRVRAGMDFFTLTDDTDRATEATLLTTRFGVDGIILFYDITTLLVSMGQPFDLVPKIGPMPRWKADSMEAIGKLNPEPKPQSYDPVLRLLERVKTSLKGELPVLVFAGASFTVASYALGLGKDLDGVRAFAAAQPKAWNELLHRITNATKLFLGELQNRGASACQLFDSWAGGLSPEDYDRWAHPHHRQVLNSLKMPRILFVKEGPYLEKMVESGATAVSLGSRHDLAEARKAISPAHKPDLAVAPLLSRHSWGICKGNPWISPGWSRGESIQALAESLGFISFSRGLRSTAGTRLDKNSREQLSQVHFKAWLRQVTGSHKRAPSIAFPRSSSRTPAPGRTTSIGPSTGKAATGTPLAIASSITRPKVSVRDGKTKTSASEYSSLSSSPCFIPYHFASG